MKYNISSDIRLNIETYYGGLNQPTHPSVISFDKPWNGYKYWMAYSPYPKGNGEEENPCIAVSNDLLFWEIPAGFLNPIANNEETGCRELKDPHILYREDLDRIEIWYLGRLHPNLGGDGETLLIFRKTSNDGVNWSEFEVLTDTRYLSPSIIWDNGIYKLWEIGYDAKGTKGTVGYRESNDGKNWTEEILCEIDGKKYDWKIWHGSVNKIGDEYYFSYIEKSSFSDKILFAISEDGSNFTKKEETIVLNKKWVSFYRPFLYFTGQKFVCYYGVIDIENNWYLSMSIGERLDNMLGIGENDIDKMIKLSDNIPDTTSVNYRVRKTMREINKLLRVETVFVLLFSAVILLLNKSWLCYFLLFLFNTAVILLYVRKFKSHNTYGNIAFISFWGLGLLFLTIIMVMC